MGERTLTANGRQSREGNAGRLRYTESVPMVADMALRAIGGP